MSFKVVKILGNNMVVFALLENMSLDREKSSLSFYAELLPPV